MAQTQYDDDTQRAVNGEALADRGASADYSPNSVAAGMAQSQATLDAYYAKNPVIPNKRMGSAPVIGGEPNDTSSYVDPGSGFAVYTPDQNSPVIANEVKQPRTAPVSTPAAPITAAAAEVPQSAPITYSSREYGPPASSSQVIQPDYGAQLRALNARDTQNFNERMDRQVASANAANTAGDLERARGEARVANFDRANARRDIAGGIGGEGRYVAGELADKAAAGANAAVTGLEGQVIQAQKPIAQTNPLDTELKLQETAQRARGAQVVEAHSQSQLITAQAQQKQQQRLEELGGKLASETDPAKHRQIQDTILTLLGKEKGERFKLTHAQGGEVLGPDGFTKIRQPDSVVVQDTQTGKIEILPLGQQGAPQAKSGEPTVGEVRVDKNGVKGKYLGNGKWGPA